MPICQTCGSDLGGNGACPYDVPLDRAPGIGDVEGVASGKSSLTDHELQIARWRVHHPDERGATPAVMAWARERVARSGQVPPG